ncbi:MAG TPA: hypothetical protein VK718_06920 [Ferruginibacter sp.]|jgi:tetratricopeptide (TPR) repeat protein|nr:hypothetical protein [Ferruginibacter sp.]
MGKKKTRNKLASAENAKEIKEPVKQTSWFSFSTFKLQALALIIIGLICFSNSFYNDYALDDDALIKKNDFVQEGIQGIPTILSSDAFLSFYQHLNSSQQLSGGRYRPLSIVTFAIEQQLFGPTDGSTPSIAPTDKVAHIRHVVNVLLYIFSVIVLFYFLRNFIFKEKPIIAFIASLLFLIHPIHTEVVANVKSRDEIMSFLFIILTFIYSFRYSETKRLKHLFIGLLFYFLALLSKEYAITLIVFIPMLLYIVKGDSLKKAIIQVLPFLGVAILYVMIRVSIVGVGATDDNPEIMNNPFLYATTPEKWATKIEILMRYLRLLFYPDPLSCDYSYNTIPYTNFANSMVWMSIAVHLSMITAAIVLFFKRNILSFALAFYLLNLFLVSNLFFDVGATMGERLVYHSSLGFVIAMAVLIEFLLQKLKYPSVPTMIVAGAFGCVIVSWCAVKDYQRNIQWKNDVTLFLHDVKVVPNSVLANGNTGKDYIDISQLPENQARKTILLDSAIYFLDRSIAIHDKFVNGYLNLGFAYSFLKQYEKAKGYVDIAKSIYSTDPYVDSIYRDIGSGYSNDAIAMVGTQPMKALEYFKKATEVAPKGIDFWNNLGYGYIYITKDYDSARYAFEKVLQLDPSNQKALAGIAMLPKK